MERNNIQQNIQVQRQVRSISSGNSTLLEEFVGFKHVFSLTNEVLWVFAPSNWIIVSYVSKENIVFIFRIEPVN
jgi:hypothetical protein